MSFSSIERSQASRYCLSRAHIQALKAIPLSNQDNATEYDCVVVLLRSISIHGPVDAIILERWEQIVQRNRLHTHCDVEKLRCAVLLIDWEIDIREIVVSIVSRRICKVGCYIDLRVSTLIVQSRQNSSRTREFHLGVVMEGGIKQFPK